MSAKNVTITVSGNVVATAGYINWIQGSGTTYTVAVNAQTDYITVTDDASGGSGAPTDGDYLVGTTNASLSAEIVVGTSPGGELGGTWASPTVDSTHSGSTHAAATTTHEAAADPHTGYVLESLLNAKGDLITASADNTPSLLTVGADDTILMADAAAGGGLKWVAPASPSAVSTAAATGTSDTFTRGDHVHAHEAAHIDHDTTWAAKGNLIAGTANDTAAVLTVGANDTVLTADSGQTTGLKWATAASGAMATDVLWDAKGDLAAGTGANTGAKLTVGANGSGVMAASGQSTGLVWVSDMHPGNKGTLPTGAIAEAISRSAAGVVNSSTTSGTLKLQLIWLPVCTVASITWMSGTTALAQGATSNHLWAALFQSDLTFLKQSTDDTNPVWAASTAKTFTLSATQDITTAGFYYIGVMAALAGGGAANPTLNGVTATAATNTIPLIAVGNSTGSLTTTAPAPATAITPGTTQYYAYVS